jgi:DNA-binding NtrC family response regulator
MRHRGDQLPTGGSELPDDTVRVVIETALAREGGSLAKAARRLGTSRASIYAKIKEYALHAGKAE